MADDRNLIGNSGEGTNPDLATAPEESIAPQQPPVESDQSTGNQPMDYEIKLASSSTVSDEDDDSEVEESDLDETQRIEDESDRASWLQIIYVSFMVLILVGILVTPVVVVVRHFRYLANKDHDQDVALYRELRAVLDDVRKARTEPQPQFGQIIRRAGELREKIVKEFEKSADAEHHYKRLLVWCARDDMSRFLISDLKQPSASESDFEKRLDETATSLGLKPGK